MHDMPLTNEQMMFWEANGFVLLKRMLSDGELKNMIQWTDDLTGLPETPGKWMKYFETSTLEKGRRILCRMENFLQYHAGFEKFLLGQRQLAILSQLMGESAVLFKEKINMKLSGGKGFTHHQDAPAFTTFQQTYHITMMVALDPATVENGCLEVARGWHKQGILPQAPDGTLAKEVIADLRWEPVCMEPGDVLFFDSYIPHGSAPNRTESSRRAMYVTYNKASEGSRRDDYFRDKRRTFPPECERVPGVDYTKNAGVYNLGNPID